MNVLPVCMYYVPKSWSTGDHKMAEVLETDPRSSARATSSPLSCSKEMGVGKDFSAHWMCFSLTASEVGHISQCFLVICICLLRRTRSFHQPVHCWVLSLAITLVRCMAGKASPPALWLSLHLIDYQCPLLYRRALFPWGPVCQLMLFPEPLDLVPKAPACLYLEVFSSLPQQVKSLSLTLMPLNHL